jgi:hypothetical protein
MISLLSSFCYDEEYVATGAKQGVGKSLEDANDVVLRPRLRTYARLSLGFSSRMVAMPSTKAS